MASSLRYWQWIISVTEILMFILTFNLNILILFVTYSVSLLGIIYFIFKYIPQIVTGGFLFLKYLAPFPCSLSIQFSVSLSVDLRNPMPQFSLSNSGVIIRTKTKILHKQAPVPLGLSCIFKYVYFYYIYRQI